MFRTRSSKPMASDSRMSRSIACYRLHSMLVRTPAHGKVPTRTSATALLAANVGGGDATFQNLRKRRTIVGRAFEFLVARTTTSEAPRSGMRRTTVGDSTYVLLPPRLQMTQPAATLPTHSPSTNPYTLSPATTSPPNTSILGKRGRGSETSSEAGDTGGNGGAARSHVLGLRTDFNILKQVSRFRVHPVDIETAQFMYTDGRAYRACTIMPLTQNSSTWTSPARTQRLPFILFLKHAITYQVHKLGKNVHATGLYCTRYSQSLRSIYK